MSDQRTVQIAKKLLERSCAGGVFWRETVDENRFAAAYADHSMSITRKGDDTYVLSVHNRHGTVVDSIDGKSYLGDEQTFEMLKELFPLAQRTGVAAIEALDELLKEQSSEEAAI